MNEVKRNQVIIIGVVILLIVCVIVSAIIYNVVNNDKDNGFKVKFDQVYNSEYDLHPLDNNIFFGTYDNKLNVFIDKDGKEIYKTDTLIDYDNYFKTIEGNYLFYSNKDNKLVVYVFDGKEFKLQHNFENVKYVKPIISGDAVVALTSFVDDKLYLYSLKNEGINVLYEENLVADKFVDNIYYSNSSEYFVVSNKNGKYGAVNISGEYIIKCEYDDLISLRNGQFIVKNSNGKYGIIDNAGNQLVKSLYDGIIPYNDYYIFIKGNKMALFDKEYNNITKFKMNYNDLLEFNYRKDLSIKLEVIGDKIVILNNYLDDYYDRDYKNHNMYIIEDGKIVDDIKQVGFYNDKVIYSYNSKYEFSIYNEDMKEINKFKLENYEDIEKINSVEYYNDDTLLIGYTTTKKDYKKLYNYDGKIVDSSKEVILSNSMYYVVKGKNKVVVYNYDNEKLAESIGNVNYIDSNFIILDKVLYKIVVE